MDLTIPTAPAGVLALLAFFGPYAVAFLNGALPFVKTAAQRKLVTLIVAVLLTAIVLVVYYAITGDTIPQWPTFVLLAIVVISASYSLVTKSSASKLEAKFDSSNPRQ